MSIDVVGLEKKFGDVTVVCGIDVHVPNGKMLVLLGPSGCGKTTTMRCIAGLDTPSRGRIEIAGNVVYDAASGTNVPVERRHVGMVFQSYAIWPHLTVFQNVAFPLEIQRIGKTETAERVHDMLTLVGLGDFAARGASQLSGGQMQRVALARSLINKPAVLLLDEPLSNLDARLRDYLRVQLREIQMQLAITAVYVTHDQHEALALADEIVVLRAGTILQRGEPIDLYGHPCSSAVAEFLGYSNIFTATVTARDGAAADAAFEPGNDRIRGTLVAPRDADVVAACVRPDDVRIAALPDAGATLAPNTFAVEVILASFEGSHIHYQARSAGGAVWDVLCADVTGALRVGSSASIHVAAESVLLLTRDHA
ncbi:MAG TPA: ABC transporter ATP-binding protein [Steroidobacteraceae bacterium]|nr:ABC transporter ATP-binding protein [Steroidobacteraceae bacterium]